eukprot:1778607-Amphidinium_carterae.1
MGSASSCKFLFFHGNVFICSGPCARTHIEVGAGGTLSGGHLDYGGCNVPQHQSVTWVQGLSISFAW